MIVVRHSSSKFWKNDENVGLGDVLVCKGETMSIPTGLIPKAKVPYKVETTDLTRITRHSSRVRCEVILYGMPTDDPKNYEGRLLWLIAGQVDLDVREKTRVWHLKAYLNRGMTDFEHDSASAFGLPLIGVEFESCYYSQSVFNGYVAFAADTTDFRVPRPGYNPAKLPGAIVCKRCTDDNGKKYEHVIVPEGNYYPPFDQELFKSVRGKRVRITVQPVIKGE